MEKILAVLVKEEKYAERLCDYVNKKNTFVFTAVPFHDAESCSEFSRKHNIEILLADTELLGNSTGYGHEFLKKPDIKATKVIRLVSGFRYGMADSPRAEGIAISKYQPADMLIRDVVDHCDGIELVRTSEIVGRPVKIIGVYSPISRCGKSSFALTLSRVLSRTRKSIYISLEEFSNMEMISGENYSACLSDAVYHMKQGTLNSQKIYSMIYHYSGIDYIPPIRYADDRNAISGDDYVRLIGMLLKNTEYEAVVVDMDRFADEASEVMGICDTIYMPVIDNYADRIKVESFINYLKTSERGQLAEKIIRINVPEPENIQAGSSYLDSLYYGNMGNMIRSLKEI